MRPILATAAAGATLVLVLVTACSSSATTGPSAGPTGCPLTIDDGWAKAADTGTTAAFARLDNPSTADVTVVSATSPASTTVELHEVVVGADGSSTMAPKVGGFVVPAGGSLTLAPGGNHLMLMALTAPVRAGDQVELTLVTGTGATCPLRAAARTFDGGNESYAPAGSTAPTMSMGSPTP